MSLWLREAATALANGHYELFRKEIFPTAPFKIPNCIIKEAEVGERHYKNCAL